LQAYLLAAERIVAHRYTALEEYVKVWAIRAFRGVLRPPDIPRSFSGGFQVADAPLARQSRAASGKPTCLGGAARTART